MKKLLLICSGLCFLAVANLPIGYYTLLRIVVTISAIAVLVKEFNNEFTTWIIVFGMITILFNPIIPIYLDSKQIWIPIDIVVGIIFLLKASNKLKI